MNPLVSVLIITYNHQKYIAQALDSVLMQKINFDYEIVIGEDCSTDRTREIVLEYKAKHPDKIKLILQKKNVGSKQNLIETFKACNGKYIAICEGDDYWTDPYKLQKQVDILEKHSEFSMCFTARNVVDSENKYLRFERYKNKIYTTQDVVEGFIPSTQTILMRNYINIIDFLRKNKNHPSGDRLLAYYCSLVGDIYYLDEITSCYRESGEGVWSSFSYLQKREKIFERLKEFYNILGISNDSVNIVHRGVYEYFSILFSLYKSPIKLLKNFLHLYKKYLGNFSFFIVLAVIFIKIKRKVIKWTKNNTEKL